MCVCGGGGGVTCVWVRVCGYVCVGTCVCGYVGMATCVWVRDDVWVRVCSAWSTRDIDSVDKRQLMKCPPPINDTIAICCSAYKCTTDVCYQITNAMLM